MAQNYYDILGVKKEASDAEIKDAYKKLAKKYHPDLYSKANEAEKKKAEEKFKAINTAYTCLSDPEKKNVYDQYGTEDPMAGAGRGGGGGFGGFSGFGGFEDLFSNIFSSFGGGGKRGGGSANQPVDGNDITVPLTISFKEAAFGCTHEIPISRVESCNDCNGSGAKGGTAFKTCSKCNGSGQVVYTVNTGFGQMRSSRSCDECKGKGKIITETCKTCNGAGNTKKVKNLNVVVPAGIDNGQMMTYYNQGNTGRNGGRNGSVIIVINVKPHPVFTRKGVDLYIDMPIKVTQAALGCKIDVPTLSGSMVSYIIPAGTQHGQFARFKGYGIKHFKKEMKGDLLVQFLIEVPNALTEKQREELKKAEEILNAANYPKQRDFMEKVKNI